MLERNMGAVIANRQMHERTLESQNNSINDKLNKIIELLEKLLANQQFDQD